MGSLERLPSQVPCLAAMWAEDNKRFCKCVWRFAFAGMATTPIAGIHLSLIFRVSVPGRMLACGPLLFYFIKIKNLSRREVFNYSEIQNLASDGNYWDWSRYCCFGKCIRSRNSIATESINNHVVVCVVVGGTVPYSTVRIKWQT
jgi:hypothetical protein